MLLIQKVVNRARPSSISGLGLSGTLLAGSVDKLITSADAQMLIVVVYVTAIVIIHCHAPLYMQANVNCGHTDLENSLFNQPLECNNNNTYYYYNDDYCY